MPNGRSWRHDPQAARRAQTVCERARGVERDLLRAVDRLQWKALPKDLPPKSTVHDFSSSGTGTAPWSASSHAVRGGARGGGA